MYILLIVAFTGFASVLSQDCTGGFLPFGQNCYAYIQEGHTWFEAESACRAFGAKLAEPQSMTENIFIKGIAIDHSATDVWLGGSDLIKSNTWYWASTGLEVNAPNAFTDWAPGQPDGLRGENCLEFHVSFNHWNDHQCNVKKAFICQKYMTSDVIG